MPATPTLKASLIAIVLPASAANGESMSVSLGALATEMKTWLPAVIVTWSFGAAPTQVFCSVTGTCLRVLVKLQATGASGIVNEPDWFWAPGVTDTEQPTTVV